MKALAKKIYFENFAILSFATLLYISMIIGFTILGNVYGSIFLNIVSENTVMLVTITSEMLGIALSFPLFFGYIYLCSRFVQNKEVKLSDIFEYYSGRKKLFSAASVFLTLLRAVIFKIVLPVTVFVFLYSEIDTFCNSGVMYLPDYILNSIKGVFLLPFLILFILCYYLLGNDIAKVMKLNFADNTIALVFDKRKFFYLRLSLIPLYVISFFTFGILFIIYTIPYTVILYCLFFKQYAPTENISLNDFNQNPSQERDFNEKTAIFSTDTEINDKFD